jgi:hypothetical protein|tara:strand:+ start:697 stop:984 length:288 start_codon:yes stop_codon:yes gene_type:complete
MNDREFKELLKLTRDNNKLLHKMRRHAIYGNIIRLFYWALILGVPIVIYYYFLQPYLEQVLEAYSGFQRGVESVQDVGSQVKGLGGILDIFGNGQ